VTEALLKLATGETENDGSAYPLWAIVEKAGFGRMAWLMGPFFSRKAAETLLESRRYHYGEKAFVWCFSGHDCRDYRDLLDAAKGGGG
jgi:hypothetical protein